MAIGPLKVETPSHSRGNSAAPNTVAFLEYQRHSGSCWRFFPRSSLVLGRVSSPSSPPISGQILVQLRRLRVRARAQRTEQRPTDSEKSSRGPSKGSLALTPPAGGGHDEPMLWGDNRPPPGGAAPTSGALVEHLESAGEGGCTPYNLPRGQDPRRADAFTPGQLEQKSSHSPHFGHFGRVVVTRRDDGDISAPRPRAR